MNIPLILGTARKGRQSEKVADYVLSVIKGAGHASEIIDVKDYASIATDNSVTSPKTKKLKEKILKADAVLIVTPEYNHGYPGELKNVLDSLYGEWTGKPVGFVGVSAGPLGGARAVEQLRQVVIELRMIPVRESAYFGVVQSLFDDKGAIKDPAFKERVMKVVDDVIKHVKR